MGSVTVCDGVTVFLGVGCGTEITVTSTQTVTDKVFAGCRGLFTKSRPVSSADSVGSQLVCHWHTLTPRRAQNLLAGCIFVGEADKSAFALLSGK